MLNAQTRLTKIAISSILSPTYFVKGNADMKQSVMMINSIREQIIYRTGTNGPISAYSLLKNER